MSPSGAHPILTCAETAALEERLFAGDESAEWRAMQMAGTAVARGLLQDFRELGEFPSLGRGVVIAGKGHNGGDALLAAGCILEQHPDARVDVMLVYGQRQLRPLALRAWQLLQTKQAKRVRLVTLHSLGDHYDFCLDGLFGFQFHPPLDGRSVAALQKINALPIKLRAAVDLPSGGEDSAAFRADFTYATGVVKQPLLALPHAGRLRYLDLGFFPDGGSFTASDKVLTSEILQPLRTWRDPHTEKRRQGHLFVVAGSRDYPGAALMTVTAALRSGAGLVSAFVPESLISAFAAQVPEAIWVGMPETPDGGLALEGHHLLKKRLARASALVLGPGLGCEAETMALAADIVKSSTLPLLVDADALQPEIISGAHCPLVLTPHAGEFARIAGKQDLRVFAKKSNATVVLKGPVTRICAGKEIHHSFFGGPVLARGGSGDLLAGIIGSQLALSPEDTLAAACRGVVWHGRAADALAQAHGSVAVRTTQLLDFLGPALRL
ncbi:MAG: NAD(P)H-hydrate dehydratase [Cephaloticoccus sp.]|nr:NAD(P)H-hydrate dehydratase [Cephaloticoccus sp.]MCF7760607.1 NAD(P)H-hydrate dehydratase [Cephaloticoccus sp.]